MIKRKATRRSELRENLRGGKGALKFDYVLEAAELGNKAKMFAEVTLMPGESIGVHEHAPEGEIYVVQSGEAYVTENGEGYTLSVGDAMWTSDGNSHSIENRTASPLVIYAIILP